MSTVPQGKKKKEEKSNIYPGLLMSTPEDWLPYAKVGNNIAFAMLWLTLLSIINNTQLQN